MRTRTTVLAFGIEFAGVVDAVAVAVTLTGGPRTARRAVGPTTLTRRQIQAAAFLETAGLFPHDRWPANTKPARRIAGANILRVRALAAARCGIAFLTGNWFATALVSRVIGQANGIRWALSITDPRFALLAGNDRVEAYAGRGS